MCRHSHASLFVGLLALGNILLSGAAGRGQLPPAHARLAVAAATDLPPLIRREVLFGNPARTAPSLSPDGTRLAYLSPDARGVVQVWLRTAGLGDDRVLTADERRGIRSYFWAYDGNHLIYLQDADGNENFHFYATNIHTDVVRDLTPFPVVQARLVARHPGFPTELLVGLNIQDRRRHDVYRLNLVTGEIVLDTENPGAFDGWRTDAQFEVRAAVALTPDAGLDLFVRAAADQPWTTVQHWGPEDNTGGPVAFSRDGITLYLESSHDANTVRLLALNLTTGEETVLAEDPEYDISSVLIHPTERVIQAVAYVRDRLEWQALDPAVAEDFSVLAQVRRGDFNIVSRDLANITWLVSYSPDDGPTSYYAYDRTTQSSTFLFTNRPTLEALALAPMQPIAYPARDGLAIHGCLTTPVGLPAENVPTVVLVHGGPWTRDSWGFHPVVQWLANRGHAVLQVNYRGSTGYGKAFLNAGNREWAGRMHDDLLDGVNWVVGQGIADPTRLGIMGGSYGGYAVLVGLAFTPEVFAVGIEQYGISNLITLRRNDPPEWTAVKPLLDQRVGNPEADEAFLRSRSPPYFVDRITAPLLIGQGANDVRVPQAESDQMVAAMRAAGKAGEYVVYADEGHGFVRPVNRLHFHALAEAFLARYPGGRVEPVGEIPGHSGTIR